MLTASKLPLDPVACALFPTEPKIHREPSEAIQFVRALISSERLCCFYFAKPKSRMIAPSNYLQITMRLLTIRVAERRL
ncbi:hypothetical protein V6N11_065184 [Hibiscus sabdariffa]|uniref:Uncharacterized protein n=1 Tax=Hibiscus sabdariffa TaxID=183260 RepID=A0ABR2QG73_9ROSI